MNDEKQLVAVAEDDLPLPTVAPDSQADALVPDEYRPALPILDAEIPALAQEVRAATRTSLANVAYGRYLAEPSDVHLRALHEALYAVAVSIPMYGKQDEDIERDAAIAVDHCMTKLGRFQPQQYKGRTLPFTAWAIRVIRNKIFDQMRKRIRAEARLRKAEARREAQIALDIFRARKEKRFEFNPAQIASVTPKLRPMQAKLLRLKARLPKLSDGQIAEKLQVTLPQLRNRWSRTRSKVKQLLKPKRVWLNPKPRWYPGAATYKPVPKITI